MATKKLVSKSQIAENKRKQNVLRNAGYNIKVDGSWGPWQQEQYNKVTNPGVLSRIKRGFTNAMMDIASADSPAAVTASGWNRNRKTGEWRQNKVNDPGVKQLRKNLSTIGGTALAITSAPLLGSTAAAQSARSGVGNTLSRGITKTANFMTRSMPQSATLSTPQGTTMVLSRTPSFKGLLGASAVGAVSTVGGRRVPIPVRMLDEDATAEPRAKEENNSTETSQESSVEASSTPQQPQRPENNQNNENNQNKKKSEDDETMRGAINKSKQKWKKLGVKGVGFVSSPIGATLTVTGITTGGIYGYNKLHKSPIEQKIDKINQTIKLEEAESKLDQVRAKRAKRTPIPVQQPQQVQQVQSPSDTVVLGQNYGANPGNQVTQSQNSKWDDEIGGLD